MTMSIRGVALFATAFFALSAGISQAAPRALVSPPAKPDGLLYVAVDGQLLIYRQDGAGPIGRITKGIDGPMGLAVDSAGTLYVANATAGNVTVYPAGARSPSLVLSDGLHQPLDVAVGADGTVYVANNAASFYSGTVVEYRAGQTQPFFTTPPYNSSGTAIFFNDAVDANGNVFVSATIGSSFGQGVLEYPAGASPSWEFLLTSNYLREALAGLAIDRWGHLIVAEEGGISAPGEIDVVDVAQREVLRKIGRDYDGANAVRLDRGSFQLFASDPDRPIVFVYAYKSGKLVRRLHIAGTNITGIALGPAAK